MLMRSDASDDPQSGVILYDSAEFTFLQETRGQNVRITTLHLKINVGGNSRPYQHLDVVH